MKNLQLSTAEARLAINLQRRMWTPSRHWMLAASRASDVESWLLNVPRFVLILAIRVYQFTVSPLQIYLFGATGGCRYTPSCSAYAMEALREHGVATGTWLAAKRICRCHPWGGCGHDPVPAKNTEAEIRNPKHIQF